jgi:hypothetical protein
MLSSPDDTETPKFSKPLGSPMDSDEEIPLPPSSVDSLRPPDEDISSAKNYLSQIVEDLSLPWEEENAALPESPIDCLPPSEKDASLPPSPVIPSKEDISQPKSPLDDLPALEEDTPLPGSPVDSAIPSDEDVSLCVEPSRRTRASSPIVLIVAKSRHHTHAAVRAGHRSDAASST